MARPTSPASQKRRKDKDWQDKKAQEVFKAILLLKTPDECHRFFRDLMTLKEIRDISERWEVAQLLDKGLSYREISEKTGMSTTTVGRIAHWIDYGEGGYRLVLDKMKKKR